MNEKSKIIYSSIAGNSSDIWEQVIPLNEKWFIMSFGGADINNGDNKSSLYLLMWNDEPIRGGIISLTGSTYEVQINKEIVGDGVKKIKIRRENKSATAKQLPCWLMAIKKS